MKAFGSLLGLLTGLAVLAGLAYGGYYLYLYIEDVFYTLDLHTRTLAAIGSAVAILCSIIIASGGKARLKSQSANPQKENLYEQAISFLAGQLQSKKTSAAEQDNFEKKMALYANQKVIALYRQLQEELANNAAKEDIKALYVKLILAMRSDIGQKDLNLKEKELSVLLFQER